MSTLKNNKSTGTSFISRELVKYFGKRASFIECVTMLFNHLARMGLPDCWNTLHITSLHKKGDLQNVNNYRGLAVSIVMAKLYASALN